MFNDDSWDDEEGGSSIEDLLREYESIKSGNKSRFLDEEEYEFIIEYFFQNNNEAEAITACEIAQGFYPYSSTILLSKAEILFQAQKYGQAIQSLDLLDSIDQENLEAVLLRADIYLAQLKYEQAALLLEQKSLVFEGRDKIELMLELSDVYDECEDFEAVYKVLQQILEIDYRNEEALHKISFWADFAEMHQQSVDLHTKIIDNDPYNALAWFNLGAALQGQKKHEQAIEAYEYCVAIDEKFEFAYRNMADAYMRLHWYGKAIESLEKNLELGKPEDVIFEAIGHCWEKQKDFDRARFYYRQAVQLNPADDTIFFRIGETYTREKKWEKAMKAYSVALNLNNENASYCLAIGNCLLELEAYHEALVCFVNAVRLKPGNKSNWVALVKCLYLSKDYKEALTQLEMARANIGDKADFDFYHAGILFELGKSKEALIYLENGLEEAPSKMKMLTEINPEILQRKSVADLVAKYKRKK
ncbi:tetratricopeptide repeat protein [Taibaiella lutea]|uniref:Tetratricopeptide repeat protein n=1 Tax=Taibaiella lutea TaxID=2608001 RepID=A0A5M6CW42_9BACT|nr:tetratricopeptide repeat protein [Taibaiella lutea]KAA5537459.1 tetratricopeptide repeat protein [Taibaiella lutea]